LSCYAQHGGYIFGFFYGENMKKTHAGLLREYGHLFGKKFKEDGVSIIYRLFGIVYNNDGIHYGLSYVNVNNEVSFALIECIDSLENLGYVVVK
jgi:hypothetical protein